MDADYRVKIAWALTLDGHTWDLENQNDRIQFTKDYLKPTCANAHFVDEQRLNLGSSALGEMEEIRYFMWMKCTSTQPGNLQR
ncbi:hypothetical protein [Rubrimonas cliftonensis]|uniref:hypothetical protein n=1 Tax=Rubrimonas cliftonensis TaxID=89524 RepID=UPI00111494D3|nr:hypothetical protein [Rubrimonas cliftonensis]